MKKIFPVLFAVVFIFLSANSAFAQSPLHTSKFFIFSNVNGCQNSACNHVAFTQQQIDTAYQSFMDYAAFVNANLTGKLTVVPQVVVISTLTTINYRDADGSISEPEAQSLVGNQVDKNVDSVFLTSPGPTTGCGLSWQIEWYSGVGGATYSYIYPNCTNGRDSFVHESLHLMQFGLEMVMKRPDVYDVTHGYIDNPYNPPVAGPTAYKYNNIYYKYSNNDYPPGRCGNAAADPYSWFPEVDEVDKMPGFEACQNFYGKWDWSQSPDPDNYVYWVKHLNPPQPDLYYYQWILTTHFPTGINYDGNYCRNGIKDFDETGVDTSPSCLDNIANPLPLYDPPATLTQLSLTIGLDGIGSTGTNKNPTIPSDKVQAPVVTSFPITVELFDSATATTPKYHGSGTIDYITATTNLGKFKTTAPIDLGAAVVAGNYTVKLSVPGYAYETALPQPESFTANETSHAASQTVNLITGDVNNDHTIDVADYTQLVKCDGKKITDDGCKYADLDDNGTVDLSNLGYDYNLFLSEYSTQFGN